MARYSSQGLHCWLFVHATLGRIEFVNDAREQHLQVKRKGRVFENSDLSLVNLVK